MYAIQTLTVNGQRYTITDANASPAIVCEASGGAISVADASHRQLAGLTFYGRTVQNGTPTPDAPIPLESAGASGSMVTAVCGKNLIYDLGRLTKKTVAGITFTPVYRADGLLDYINVNGTCTASGWSDYDVMDSGKAIYFPLPQGATVTLSGGAAKANLCLESGSGGTKQVFTNNGYSQTKELVNNTYCAYIRVWAGNTVNNARVYPLLELGDTATAYEPPKPKQEITVATPNGLRGIPVASGGNYTDSTGQAWACDEMDFARGVHVQKIGVIDSYAGEAIPGAYLSSTGELTAGAQVQYVLQSPKETPLSEGQLAAFAALHSNKPHTAIHNDAGAGMALSYVADTKAYIDNKLASLT